MKALSNFFRFREPASPQIPTVARKQSVEQMLEVLKNAELDGRRVGVNPATKGLFLRSDASPGTPWGFLKTLFSKKPIGIENREEIVGAVIRKMKYRIKESTKHVDQVMTKHLPDLGRFAQTGQIGDLQKQWTDLQSILNQGTDNFKKPQRARQESIEAKSLTPARPVKDKPVSIVPKSLDVTALTPSNSRKAVADALISEVNRSLPAAMPPITQPGETVRCTLAVPTKAHADIFRNFREWDVHQPNSKTANDTYAGLSEAFFKDSHRTTYVFETDDFPIECERDSEAVAIGFKQAAGDNPSRQRILSHALGQEPVKNMLHVIQGIHPTKDGRPFFLGGDSSPGSSLTKIHMNALANGDVEVDFQYWQRSAYLNGDQGLIPINRSEKFNGPLSQDNAGMKISMKIRISGEGLDRQRLDFTIVKPLTAELQVEVPEAQAE